MKKLLLYSTLILALGACKNDASTKKDEKSTPPSTTGTESGSTTTSSGGSTTGTSTPETTTGSWSSTDKDVFLRTCTDAAKGAMGESKAKDYCSCMLDKIEVMYPNSQDAGKMTTEQTTEMAKECLK